MNSSYNNKVIINKDDLDKLVNGGSYPASTVNFFDFVMREFAGLYEGQRVLIRWFETVGGVLYAETEGGWVVMYNRPGFKGITLRRNEKPFITYQDCLEWCLDFAEQTIRADEHGKAYGKAVLEISDLLYELGVSSDIIENAVRLLRDKKTTNLNV